MTTLGTVLVALIGVVVELLRRQHKALGAVQEQVHNAHGTNLRDDLDKVIAGVDQLLDGQDRHDQLLREHARDIGGLRAELRHERAERLAVERRLDALTTRER
ncbi:DUF2746 domain-containing protein [Actinoplanes sp. NPDC049118]|uniref:DUF2746 domain-containing protein n=1 Tax=Actinoplanes sp. NPDC049118 TaxID=3155769 RepID=UPI0034094A06